MEKYSAYRDPGTGIQPFLPPVPPLSFFSSSIPLPTLLRPLTYPLAFLRTTLILVLALLYLLLVPGLCTIFKPIPALHRSFTYFITAFLARLVLLLLGVLHIRVERVQNKQNKLRRSTPPAWSPRAGDLILSNWTGYLEILYLSFRYNPIFLLPLPSSSPSRAQPTQTPPASPRRPSQLAPSARPPSAHSPLTHYLRVSLLSLITTTGHVPPYGLNLNFHRGAPLQDIIRKADRPVVLFPEGTTSNGRGLLRFGDIDLGAIKGGKVYLMCVRPDPPTPLRPSPALSIPSRPLNPVPHIFCLTTALLPQPLSIRLTLPSDELNTIAAYEEALASGGKLKRLVWGWEDKYSFLEFYRGKKSR